jgi:hypothetical protein
MNREKGRVVVEKRIREKTKKKERNSHACTVAISREKEENSTVVAQAYNTNNKK